MRAAVVRSGRPRMPVQRQAAKPPTTTPQNRKAKQPRIIPYLLSIAFLFGYLAGIPLGRIETVGYGTALAKYYMEPSNFQNFSSAFTGLFSGAFLQSTWVLLCGFHMGGETLLAVFFASKGILMGLCASCVYLTGGAHALFEHWLITCLPDLALFFAMLWLSIWACRLSGFLRHMALNGGRKILAGEMRQLLFHYLITVTLCTAICAFCAGLDVFFVRILF